MCMFCAAVPVAGAIGAKINADQIHKSGGEDKNPGKPVLAVTTGVICLLVVGSVVYHTTFFGK